MRPRFIQPRLQRELHSDANRAARRVEAPGTEEVVVERVECRLLFGKGEHSVAIAKAALRARERDTVGRTPPARAAGQVDRIVGAERTRSAGFVPQGCVLARRDTGIADRAFPIPRVRGIASFCKERW